MKHAWIAGVAICLVATSGAVASVLDWSAAGVNYPVGSAGPVAFSNVDASGVDMTFTWSGDTGEFLTGYNHSPGNIVTLPDDDYAASVYGMSGLWYGVNFSSNTQSVTLTIDFSQPVNGVQFSVSDIDGINPIEEAILLKGFNGASAVSPYAITAGSGLIVTPGAGSLTVANDLVADPDPHNLAQRVTVGFSGWLDQITLQFTTSPAGNDRGEILSNITFVPEPASVLLLVIGSALLMRRHSVR